MSLTVVAETNHYVIVDKPALLDSQNSRDDRGSVVDWLKGRFGFAGLVHRLDFGTSGLMVCAKNAAAAARLTADLQAGKINRKYLAFAIGAMTQPFSRIDAPLDGKEARTSYEIIERFPNATLAEVELETGRKHQIRRHFWGIGHPLLGDTLYRKRGSERLFHRPALHAHKLCVDGRWFEAPCPSDFSDLIKRLRAMRS